MIPNPTSCKPMLIFPKQCDLHKGRYTLKHVSKKNSWVRILPVWWSMHRTFRGLPGAPLPAKTKMTLPWGQPTLSPMWMGKLTVCRDGSECGHRTDCRHRSDCGPGPNAGRERVYCPSRARGIAPLGRGLYCQTEKPNSRRPTRSIRQKTQKETVKTHKRTNKVNPKDKLHDNKQVFQTQS